jgi:hypothetical protein
MKFSRRMAVFYAPLPFFVGYCYYVMSDRFAAHHVRREEIVRERRESEAYRRELTDNLQFLEGLKDKKKSEEGSGEGAGR